MVLNLRKSCATETLRSVSDVSWDRILRQSITSQPYPWNTMSTMDECKKYKTAIYKPRCFTLISVVSAVAAAGGDTVAHATACYEGCSRYPSIYPSIQQRERRLGRGSSGGALLRYYNKVPVTAMYAHGNVALVVIDFFFILHDVPRA